MYEKHTVVCGQTDGRRKDWISLKCDGFKMYFVCFQSMTCRRLHLQYWNSTNRSQFSGKHMALVSAPERWNFGWVHHTFPRLPVCSVFWRLAVHLNVQKWEARHSGECFCNNQVAQCNFGVKHDYDLHSCCPPTQTRSMARGGRYASLFSMTLFTLV